MATTTSDKGSKSPHPKTRETAEAGGKAANGKGKDEVARKEGKSRIKYESSMPRDEAVAYFEAIVAGLRKGAIKFKRGEEVLSMSPGDHVEVEVKATHKRNKDSVSFEISWRAEGEADLTISAS